MALPIAMILAGLTGGATIGYAQTKGTLAKEKREEESFLKKFEMEQEAAKDLADYQSGIRVSEEKAKTETALKAEYAKYGLIYGVNTPQELLIAKQKSETGAAVSQAAQIEDAKSIQKNLNTAAEFNIDTTKVYNEQGVVDTAIYNDVLAQINTKQAQQEKKKFEKQETFKFNLKKQELELKNNMEEAANIAFTINVPNSEYKVYTGDTPAREATASELSENLETKFKKVSISDTQALLKNGNIKESFLVLAQELDNQVSNIEQIMRFGPENEKKKLMSHIQRVLVGHNQYNMYDIKPVTDLNTGLVRTIKVKAGNLQSSLPNLSGSEIFKPLVNFIAGSRNDRVQKIEEEVENILNVPVIAMDANTSVTQIEGRTETMDTSTSVNEDGTDTYNCAIVDEMTKNSCEQVRKIIDDTRPNFDLKQKRQVLNNHLIFQVEKNKTNYGTNPTIEGKGTYIEGNPDPTEGKGGGFAFLQLVNQLNKNLKTRNVWVDNLNEVSFMVESRSMTPDMLNEMYPNPKDRPIAAPERYYKGVVDSFRNAGLYDFNHLISFAYMGAAPNWQTGLDIDTIFKNNGFESASKVSADKKSLEAVRQMGILYIETNPNDEIASMSNLYPEYAHFAKKYNLKADTTATQLQSGFLSIYNTIFNVLPDQAQAFVRDAVATTNENDFVSGLINVFTTNKGDGFRWKDEDINSKQLTLAREGAMRYIYDDKGKLVNKVKFKDNEEYLKYEREAYDRNVQRLNDIQERIRTNNDAVGARRDLIKFMMAYELASFMQGGTGGRTISDQDVENMLRAIGEKNWTNSKAVVSGTLQLLTKNEPLIAIHNALTSTDPAMVMAGLYSHDKFYGKWLPQMKEDRKFIIDNAFDQSGSNPKKGNVEETTVIKYQLLEDDTIVKGQ